MKAPNPIAFSFFNIDIRWYGILIAIGALLAVILSYKRAPLHNIDSENVLDAAIVIIPAGIIGARIYYVFFNYNLYAENPLSVFDIRGGGLAIHGGIIFGILSAIILCKIKKINILELSDLLFPSLALAQSIGRWGNFFNSEAYGTKTSLPWAILINGENVHPTFLYESIWCFLLFFVLIHIDNNRKFTGQVTFLYGMLYSFERFFVEGLRTDSLMIGPFRQAQVISVIIFISCAFFYYTAVKLQQTAIKKSKPKNK